MNNGILIKANSRRVLTRLASRKKEGKKLYFELKWLLLSKITRLHEEAPVESIKGSCISRIWKKVRLRRKTIVAGLLL